MMKRVGILCVGGLLALGCGGELAPPEEATQELPGSGGPPRVAPPPQLILLSVDQIEPMPPAENRPVYLHFTLTNSTRVARSGQVQAAFTKQDGSPVYTNAWSVQLAANASTQGILEVDAPYAGPAVAYAVHYFDSSAPTVPAESTATQGTMKVALRARYAIGNLEVVPADSTFGDHDALYFDSTFNGSPIDSQSAGLGYVHAGFVGAASLSSPVVNLVPGTADVVRFHSRVGMAPNFAGVLDGGDVTMVEQTITLSGDAVRAAIPDGSLFSNAQFDTTYCNYSPGPLGCGGASPDYYLDAAVDRISRGEDTLSLPAYTAQIRTGQQLVLTLDYRASAQILSGSGSVYLENLNEVYLPPVSVSAPTLTKILITEWGQSAIVYVETR